MKGLEAVLEKVPLFEDLEPRYLQLLAGCASNVRFEAGESIYANGDDATSSASSATAGLPWRSTSRSAGR